MMGDPTRLTLRTWNRTYERETGVHYEFMLGRFRVYFLEWEDLHFNHDSSVLIADHRDTASADDDDSTGAQADHDHEHITALAVIAAAYNHIKEHPEQKLLLVGHTDRSGPASYNLALSRRRAQNVLYLLRGDKDAWAQHNAPSSHHEVEDYQQLLKWLFAEHDWDTDPGDVDNERGPLTRAAIERFQIRYNQEYNQSIAEDGVVGEQTWGAFFDIYMQELRDILDVDEAGFAAMQQSLTFLSNRNEFVGCGESWPLTAENRSRTDRRVELYFFDPGEEPTLPLPCHPSNIRCLKDVCEIHDDARYQRVPIPVEPILPPRYRLRVHLLLVWKDPEEHDHPFPRDMNVMVSFGDGSADREVQVGVNGVLDFIVDKRKVSFSLDFSQAEASYFVTLPAASSGSDNEKLVVRPDVAPLIREGARAFLLPVSWDLGNCDWEVDTATATTYNQPDFESLESLEEIGTHDSPCRVELKPHWQYMKVLYFDRKIKRKLSILPVMVEGFLDRDNSAGEPETQSNWSTEAEACQCLPWLRQKADNGSEISLDQILLQFRSKEHTFIDATTAETSGGGRKLVTKDADPANDDPGLNEGENTTLDFSVPSAERLAFYDLPAIWKSRTYFTKLDGETPGQFETLANQPTTDAKPLLFSLDDIVLTDAALQPLSTWTPTTDTANRVALFSHTFAGGANLADYGLYKPDSGNRQAYFSERPRTENNRNYIADYPDWTRLVITQGNLFDCFDQRVQAEPDGVVGARAAVLWVDATATAAGANHPHTSLQTDARHTFFSSQPFYEHEFFNRGINSRTGSGLRDEWNHPIAPADNQLSTTGRFDLAHLRCCDASGNDEVAVAIRYHRYNFDFVAKPNDLDDAHTTAATRTRDREQWVSDFLSDCANRWNGDDGVNGNRSVIAQKMGTPKLRTTVISFLQHLGASNAHFKIDLVAEDQTSNMGSRRGRGELRVAAGRDTDGEATDRNFAGAHETGHAGSLPDEYPRRNNGLGQEGFGSNHVPGAAFSLDRFAMMKFNHFVRARYFWHVAEWLRTLPNLNMDFQIIHGSEQYELPHYQHQATRPKRNYTYWPVRAKLRHQPSDPILYDSYLYMLGKDQYRSNVLPRFAGISDEVDGILVVIIKARFDFEGWIDTESRRERIVTRIRQRINSNLNKKCFAAFTVAPNPTAPPAFTKCLLHFSIRFRHGSAANEHIFSTISEDEANSFDGSEDPRELVIKVADSVPGSAADISREINRAADSFFPHACTLLGLSHRSSPANSYTKANAYINIVRSVAGDSVTPTMTR